jgi:hypothetical protein
MAWEPIAGGVVMVVMAGLGLVLAAVTLPGVWLILLAAVGVKLWQPELLSWWTIGAGVGLALLGEIIEAVASALGAKKFGGSGWGAGGSIVGALVGAVLGTLVPVPILGTLAGAIVGAGVGALVAELWIKKRTIQEARRSATGAVIGRAVATVVKITIAGLVAGALVLGVLIPVM